MVYDVCFDRAGPNVYLLYVSVQYQLRNSYFILKYMYILVDYNVCAAIEEIHVVTVLHNLSLSIKCSQTSDILYQLFLIQFTHFDP